MNRTKTFAYNSITQAIAQVVLMLVGFIVPKIMLVYYGSDINGLVTSITQFISYFNLVEAGLSSSAIYALYKPIANNDKKRIDAILNTTRKAYFQSGIIFAVLVGMFAFIYPLYINTVSLNYLEILFLIVILGVNGALEFFAQGQYKVYLMASQRYYVISISNICYYLINALLIYWMANAGANVVIMRLVATIALVIRFAIIYYIFLKNYGHINDRKVYDDNALSKRWDALFLQILGVVQAGAPVVILTLITKNLKLVSIYSIYSLVISGVANVVGIFTSGLSASFGDVIARNEQIKLQETYRIFETAYYALITFVYSCTVVLLIPFISVYTKGIEDVNYVIPITGILFCIQSYIHSLKTPQGMLVLSAGLYKETRYQTLAQALILIVVGIPFSYFWGINGILFAMLASELYRLIDLVIFIPHNVTGLSPWETVRRIAYSFIIFMPAVVASVLYIKTFNSYLFWVLYALLIALIVGVLEMVVLVLFDRERIFACFRVVKRIVR